MRVLVTDGDNRAALAVTRSLGRAGHHVVVGERQSPALAHASRYCGTRLVYPDPVSRSEEFVDYLEHLVREHRIDVLLPVADITTFLVTRHRERFGLCAIPFAPFETVERAADKVGILRAAQRLGVPVPRTVVVADPARVPEHDLEFPLVIKPRQSRVQTADGWASSGVSYAASAEELTRDLASRPSHHYPLMLQERIVGPGVGVFACYHDGRPVALFSHRRLRERPPWGGVSVLSESVPLCPLASSYATALLDDLGWSGVAMVEFKLDSRDNLPKLMEINGRFWGSLQLAVDAGVDFPNLLVRTTQPGGFEPQHPYRIGVRNRWLWGDFDSLLLSLSGRGAPPATGRPGPRRTLIEFAKFWGRGLHYDNPKPYDPRPWLLETYKRMQSAAAALTARGEGNGAPDAAGQAPRAAATRRAAGLHADIAASLEGAGVDADGWNALVAASDTNTVFQTYEWTRSWWGAFGEHYTPMFVSVAGASGVVALAPFVVEQRTTERVVRLLGDGRADYLDFIAPGDKAPVISAVFDALRQADGWDVIELNNIPGGSRTMAAVQEICGALGFRILVDDQYPCPTLVIQGHEDEARKIQNKPSLRRRSNYFRRNGRLSCRNLVLAADVHPLLDTFFAQHVARWSVPGSRGTSLFTDERNRFFYRLLTTQIASRGWLLFSIVEFNDRPIAFHYGFDYDGVVTWYKPSFDVEFEQHSPGIVMVQELIGYALERGRRELDFTVGDEPFKRRFTNTTRKTCQVSIFSDPARFYWECSKRELRATVRKLSR